MADDNPPMIHVRRSVVVRAAIAVAVLASLGIGFAVGWAVHSPTTSPTKSANGGTLQHFFENSTTTTTHAHAAIPGRSVHHHHHDDDGPDHKHNESAHHYDFHCCDDGSSECGAPGGSGGSINVLRQAGFKYAIDYEPVSGCPDGGMVLSRDACCRLDSAGRQHGDPHGRNVLNESVPERWAGVGAPSSWQ